MARNARRLSLLTLVLMFALAACGSQTPQTPAAADPSAPPAAVEPTAVAAAPTAVTIEPTAIAPEPVTLKVMNWSQEQAEFYQEAAAAFQQEYPHITVQWDTLAQDQYRETLPLMFQSGDAPDIFFWIGRNRVLTMAELVDQGWVAPLAPADADLTEWQTRWPEGSFVEGINMQDGQIYSFPFNDNKIWGPGYMFINRTVYRAAGLDPDAPPTTWSELLETCRTIKASSEAYCLAVPLKGNHLQRTWYPLAGSIMTDSFFDLKNGRFAIDDPRMLEAFDFLQTFYQEDLVVPGINDHTFARQAMATGQAAIYFDGAWMPGVFDQMGFGDLDLGVAAPPYPDSGERGALGQTLSENKFYVSSASEHPEAAWLFLEWMTRPAGFFAQEYLKRGFGTLGYADNAALISDPAMLEVAKIADELRVMLPEPAIACPDVGQSKAYLNAEAIRKDWEWEAMVEALTTGADFAPVAAEIATAKNAMFQQTLAEEQAAGLDVSPACYTFADWNYGQPFNTSGYVSR
ncbi:extracellular solute-binding protein [Candidatus Gracilibacteria bacterium]|nr:extracellular solute-binding protein [Candidatus Gracilibacteria bacterium]